MRAAWMSWIVLVVGLLGIASAAPNETFDLVTYRSPSGWAVQKSSDSLTFQTVDKKRNTFALIMLAPSTASAGALDKDFQAAWASVAASFHITEAPQFVAGAPENGWGATSGTAKGTYNGVATAVVLVTMTGHGRTTNILVVTNSDTYSAAIDGFLSSVKMGVPTSSAPGSAQPPGAPPAPSAPATPPQTGGATTTFSDGWIAKAEPEWVRVTRDGATVFLHFGLAFDDAMRRDTIGVLWAKLIDPRYTVRNFQHPQRSGMNFPYDFAQAEVTDRATGTSGFLSFRVIAMNGTATCIEVVTPSRAAFEQLFPDQDTLASITNANRFAIDKRIVGTWTSFSGAANNMYYTATGGYAGMNAAAIASTFVFGPTGAYKSEHKGATGMVGNMATFQERFAGTYATAPWEITVKKTDGSTTVYTAHFAAVRNGLVLHLQDKLHTGTSYALVRDK